VPGIAAVMRRCLIPGAVYRIFSTGALFAVIGFS
jgi:hypothetical protein